MIIKSHIRGGYRSAAEYLKAIGENEKTRVVQISDPDAKNLDDAFHNMWTVACNTKAKKPLHHISINPFKDERLTEYQLLRIIERCEEKYGYKHDDHQRVIVEHIKHGRQHFHVMWNRVSLTTNRSVWPGEHWKKSKQTAREMEKELGLKTPIPKRLSGIPQQRFRPQEYRRWYGMTGSLKVPSFRAPKPNITSGFRPSVHFEPAQALPKKKGWPLEAIHDWKAWGRSNPVVFFIKWPDLKPPGFVFQSTPN